MGLAAPRYVGSSRIRDRTRVPCIGRRILNHCATREVLQLAFLVNCMCLANENARSSEVQDFILMFSLLRLVADSESYWISSVSFEQWLGLFQNSFFFLLSLQRFIIRTIERPRMSKSFRFFCCLHHGLCSYYFPRYSPPDHQKVPNLSS